MTLNGLAGSTTEIDTDLDVGRAAGLLTLGAISGAGRNLDFGAIDGTGIKVSGAITTGAGTLTSNDEGTINLNGSNTYTGATTVTDGTLKAGVASVANTSGAFGNNSVVTMGNNDTAILDITGFDTQVGSLAGGGGLGVTIPAGTLRIIAWASASGVTMNYNAAATASTSATMRALRAESAASAE